MKIITFVVKPISKTTGATLVELLFYIIITGVIFIFPIHTFNKLTNLHTAKFILTAINSSIKLAQITAINTHTEIKICPKNMDWSQGLEILQTGHLLYSLSYKTHGHLYMRVFGNHKNCLSVLPNGMTHNNGHFAYMDNNFNYNINYRLVFNKGLRTYKLTDD